MSGDASESIPGQRAAAAVTLRVRAEPAGVRLARTAVTCEAAAAGLSVDRIGDAQQIVAELAALWQPSQTAGSAAGSTLQLDITSLPGQLRITASATPARRPSDSAFAWTLIEELCDRAMLRDVAGQPAVEAVIGHPATGPSTSTVPGSA